MSRWERWRLASAQRSKKGQRISVFGGEPENLISEVTYELPVLLVGLLLYLVQETFYSSLHPFACHCAGMVASNRTPCPLRTAW